MQFLKGKSGTTLNSDVALGVIISFFSSVFCQLTCVHLITSKGMKSLQSNPIATSSPRRVLHGRTALIVGYIVAIGLVTLLLPSYSALSPKRLWLQHISRIMCSDDHISSSTCTSDAGLIPKNIKSFKIYS